MITSGHSESSWESRPHLCRISSERGASLGRFLYSLQTWPFGPLSSVHNSAESRAASVADTDTVCEVSEVHPRALRPRGLHSRIGLAVCPARKVRLRRGDRLRPAVRGCAGLDRLPFPRLRLRRRGGDLADEVHLFLPVRWAVGGEDIVEPDLGLAIRVG